MTAGGCTAQIRPAGPASDHWEDKRADGKRFHERQDDIGRLPAKLLADALHRHGHSFGDNHAGARRAGAVDQVEHAGRRSFAANKEQFIAIHRILLSCFRCFRFGRFL